MIGLNIKIEKTGWFNVVKLAYKYQLQALISMLKNKIVAKARIENGTSVYKIRAGSLRIM